MTNYFSALLHHDLENELVPLLRPGLKNLLYHMIAIDIFGKEPNFRTHVGNQDFEVFG